MMEKVGVTCDCPHMDGKALEKLAKEQPSCHVCGRGVTGKNVDVETNEEQQGTGS